MLSPTLLVTSFRTWKPEQGSNSSDDLLADVSSYCHSSHLKLLRQIPVDFQLAPERVIKAIQSHAPAAIICCGMGEMRSHLCVEDRATHDSLIRYTGVNVNHLVSGLSMTRISHDAGQFVCNRLYFEVLDYIQHQDTTCPCVFVHVPVLTDANRKAIVADFQDILLRMQLLVSRSTYRPVPLFNPLSA
ncbi:MAG: peptidase C15 [Cyanobacteria bacterium P01_F01_bin.150]